MEWQALNGVLAMRRILSVLVLAVAFVPTAEAKGPVRNAVCRLFPRLCQQKQCTPQQSQQSKYLATALGGVVPDSSTGPTILNRLNFNLPGLLYPSCGPNGCAK